MAGREDRGVARAKVGFGKTRQLNMAKIWRATGWDGLMKVLQRLRKVCNGKIGAGWAQLGKA